jgi:hypothetical protein
MAEKYYMVLDDYPEHAAALGRLLGHWAALETCLMTIMSFIIEVDDIISYFIYNEFVNTKSKIILIQRINNFLNKDDKLKEDIAPLLSSAFTLNRIRNDFVHAYWKKDDTDPTKLIRINYSFPAKLHKLQKPQERFTSKDIQDVGEKIAKLCQSFDDLLYPV